MASRNYTSYLSTALLFIASLLLLGWGSEERGGFAMAATVTEQWEAEYSKVGEVMHTYASNTKFKALKGVMVVPSTKEVIWLTEKCSFLSSGDDDCDFYLQNVQTLKSIEDNPICRRAGGLSFSLDPWDTSDIWGSLYRKVYYPNACASILRSSIAGSTMFDADWDLKQLVNDSLGIGSRIDGYQSVDDLVDLNNFYPDPSAQNHTGSSSTATTNLIMTRLWVAVVGIEEAVTPDHSVLYFGNVSIEVKAASVVKNISTPSGFSDADAPLPQAYAKFIELINARMPVVLRELKSFRQLAQLALAQEAVKFINARQGVFPEGYLQALDYTLEVPQQVPAVVSTIERETQLEIVAQLLRSNHTNEDSFSDTEEPLQETLTAAKSIEKRDMDELNSIPVMQLGDNTNYQYVCSVVNGSLAHVHTLRALQAAQLLSFNCAQILEKEDTDDDKDESNASQDKPVPPPDGIFNLRPGLGDPCLPGTVAVWDTDIADYVMFPSAYLFIPGIPRMFNITGEVVVVKWSCTWPESQEGGSEEGAEEGGGGAQADQEPPLDENHASLVHTHTHYGAYPPHTRNPANTRRLQLQYNLTLPGHTEASRIDHRTTSLRDKVVLVMMPRSWETLPAQCALPQVLHELQTEWIFGADGLTKEEEIDLDGPTPVASTGLMKSRFRSVSVGTLREGQHNDLGYSEGRPDIAGLILVHHTDFIIPVVEIDSAYLDSATLSVPVRVMSQDHGTELAELVASMNTQKNAPLLASMACGISRAPEAPQCNGTGNAEDEAEDNTNAVYTVEFGKSIYRTLDNININSKLTGCQTEYLQIPEGFELVPPLPDILTYVVSEHTWGTEKVILSDMNAYLTSSTTTDRPGKLVRQVPVEWDAGSVANPQNYSFSVTDTAVAIRPSACFSRILIRTKAVMVPYGGFFYHTLDLAEVDGTSSGCQVMPLVLPEFLDVAPAISDVINNIVSPYGWSTDALVLQDKRGYFTGRAGTELAGKMCCDRQEVLFVADQPRSSYADHANHTSPDGIQEEPQRVERSRDGGNSSAPNWRDTEQVLSVMRCNTRILVRQPIVAFNKEAAPAPSTLQFLDLKKTTQAVSINITRISSGPQERRVPYAEKNASSDEPFQAKLLPGAVASHIYSLSMKLSYSQFTHGGVDLMNIKVTRMSEVPAEVLQQLQERIDATKKNPAPDASRSEGFNDAGKVDEFTSPAATTSSQQPVSPSQAPAKQQEKESSKKHPHDKPRGQSPAQEKDIHAAGSKALGGQFAVDFQEKRNAWGKRLGAAMDHLDNHILGNVLESAEGAAHKVDFIYRPSSVAAQRERAAVSIAREPSSLLNDADDAVSLVTPTSRPEAESLVEFVPSEQVSGEGVTVLQLLQQRVARVKVVRRRYFISAASVAASAVAETVLEDSAVEASVASSAGASLSRGSARAVSALLVETVDASAQFLVQYQESGLVTATLVSTPVVDGTSEGVISGSTTVTIKSAADTEYGLFVSLQPMLDRWKLQQRWTDVAVSGALTVVNLLRHLQIVADARSLSYNAVENNSHMCQEDARRFLGLTVEVASALQL